MDAEFPSGSTGAGHYLDEAALRLVTMVEEFRRTAPAAAAELRHSIAVGDIDSSSAISNRLFSEMQIIEASLQTIRWGMGAASCDVFRVDLEQMGRTESICDPKHSRW